MTGKDDDEHFSLLEAVLKSFKEYGLTIKTSKCHFSNLQFNTYIGKIINKDDIQASEKKIEAIQKVRVPTDVHN